PVHDHRSDDRRRVPSGGRAGSADPMSGTRRRPATSWRLGFDIGGTFTDFVLQRADTGEIFVGKHLTTPHDPSEGVFLGLAEVLEAASVSLGDVAHAVHGTTLGANLVIERKGARTFLIMTRGFRDVLEIQRQLRYN